MSCCSISKTSRVEKNGCIVSLPFPMFDKSIPDLEIRNAVFGRLGLGAVAREITLPSFRIR